MQRQIGQLENREISDGVVPRGAFWEYDRIVYKTQFSNILPGKNVQLGVHVKKLEFR